MGHMTFHELHKNKAVAVQLPLSKSISNRVLMCAALSGADFSDFPLSSADDTSVLLQMLEDFRAGRVEFNAGNGAAGFRFMMALLSSKNGQWKLHASEQLLNRPHDVLINILREQGAEISEQDNGFTIVGADLKGGEIHVDISQSSQYLSALMMIGPFMKIPPTFILSNEKVSFPYIQMSLHVLRDFGIDYEAKGSRITLHESSYEKPLVFRSERDWSSAAFWFELAILFPELKIYFPELYIDSLQPDYRAREYFMSLGAYSYEENGSLFIASKLVSSELVSFDMRNCPDLFLPLAITCVGLGLEANFYGIKHLAYKESNRLALVQKNLKLFSIESTLSDSGEFHIPGNQVISTKENYIDHGEDHRMAMAFAILSLKYPQIKISDMSCVSKSYPEFIGEFDKIKKMIL
jgi:3-phosphoshikimate 1-carboxyvinyltransferase